MTSVSDPGSTVLSLLPAGAYWGRRRESVEVCAARLLRLVEGLAAFDGRLSGWYPVSTRADQPARTDEAWQPDVADLRARLLEGRLYDDYGRLMPNTGYRVSAHGSGDDLAEVLTLRVTCGADAEFPNRVVLHGPKHASGQVVETLTDAGWLGGVLEVLVRVFEPDHAETMSARAAGALTGGRRVGPGASWLLWLPVGTTEVPELPAENAVRPLAHGTLISSVPGGRVPPVPSDEQVRMLRVRNQILDDAGLLGE